MIETQADQLIKEIQQTRVVLHDIADWLSDIKEALQKMAACVDDEERGRVPLLRVQDQQP